MFLYGDFDFAHDGGVTHNFYFLHDGREMFSSTQLAAFAYALVTTAFDYLI